ncbi:MAG: Polyprenyl synthetase superfamily [Candidatus Daviesbacteria bacterium GW2011_GWA1_41_61]|uniref:Polyprenyl synthetase superfamily n=1 Tax=Candidatus Daviesbacteria bacterium GW2011_GWA2_40_9 TaxID=1618424 RepID=A0A0G0U913_9BACT|nr:MAG: Polyprenyl synthetase superfamily [Candidatus Daviesbacteria bacterium GW2011_GWC1_40_9]KKR83731.1 MAG: Polyprenyl synthetase superfamily [Candidatus Daviesbacteria bacterium GW2011_GWA2_40_9]KKR93674.1 MAG: Polyprenyl synthetase superfamily [Candidatus Daviesbacteria bacterium GW2011_GWB1_41_15]KKS15140.1 MAG: Polyprenyl synthetase superfamily [Candidatus Daviesbacteria bacterium GW2011_GWA1_41_61]
MDFLTYLETAASEINEEMEKFFQSWSKEVASVSPKLISLNKVFIQASEGGKRLRGALVKLGYEMAGGKENADILKAAVAFEIFQTAILAHDDIIDLSPLRRGKPTVYKALGGDHYAISQTICLGDIGYFLAVRSISQSNFPDQEKNQALSLFAQAMLDTALGQMLDVQLPHEKDSAREADALAVFRLKTARYTISGPLHLGAIVGGANKKLIDDIAEFGSNLGIAFQIQDDILGVFGDEATLGKSVTSDIEEGKNTLLFIQALKKASAEKKKVLDSYYGKGKIGQQELEQIKKVFVDTGALEYSQKKAAQLVEEAKAVVKTMDIAEDKRFLLYQMADFLVSRKK